MMKTPEELAHETAYELGANNIEYEVAKKAFIAGFHAGREMSNKEIFDEYMRIREKQQTSVVERIKVRVMGIFG